MEQDHDRLRSLRATAVAYGASWRLFGRSHSVELWCRRKDCDPASMLTMFFHMMLHPDNFQCFAGNRSWTSWWNTATFSALLSTVFSLVSFTSS